MPNEQLVARHGGLVVVLNPKQRMTPREALEFAAWLVALSEFDSGTTFDEVRKGVEGT